MIPFHFIPIQNWYETLKYNYYLNRSCIFTDTVHLAAASAVLIFLLALLVLALAPLAATLRRRLRLRPLVRLLGNLQNLLERLTGVQLHSGLHMGQPGIALVTLAVASAATAGYAGGV